MDKENNVFIPYLNADIMNANSENAFNHDYME